MGELVELPSDGSTAGAYLAFGEGAGLGVVLIHGRWGLTNHVKDVCDRFASEGFTALAPDLYGGTTVPPTEDDEAKRRMMALPIADVEREMSVAVDFLVGHRAVRGHGIAVVGFGMGGGLALWLATLRPDQVRAVVPFYGAIPWPDAQPDWARLDAAVEVHYGQDDDWATPEFARAVERELVSRGREVRLFIYPGAGHAFFNNTRPDAYHEDAARQAWVRTLEFLRAKLG